MIQVESRKTFKHGFVLTEAELRRIVDNISEQFQKLGETPSVTYKMTFRNGVIADTSSLDEVLSQENIGSGQIVSLGIRYRAYTESKDAILVDDDSTLLHDKTVLYGTTVLLQFANVDVEEEPGYVSVRFLIRGQSRDWVFVTSTILEERVTKIKRFALNQMSGKGPGRAFVAFVGPLVIVLGLLVGLFTSIRELNKTHPGTILEEAWKSGKVKDPIEAIVMVEKLRDQALSRKSSLTDILMPLAVIIGLLLCAFLIGYFLIRYYPAYNFCWGDYLDVFQRKESRRKFILVVVLVGVLVSFVGGILANSMHHP
jgi:hypothetical protein